MRTKCECGHLVGCTSSGVGRTCGGVTRLARSSSAIPVEVAQPVARSELAPAVDRPAVAGGAEAT